jgi:hypothetical protein
MSEPFGQKRGLLQGNPLSCSLFNAFIDPLVCKLGTGSGFRAASPADMRVDA